VKLGKAAASLFGLQPSPPRLGVALQAGLAMGIPNVGLALAGHADLGMLASLGAFVALFLAGRTRRERIVFLPLVAVGLAASAAVGVATSGHLLSAVIALFLVAVIGTAVTTGLSTGPPGGLLFVLVAGVAGHLTAPPELEGAGLDPRAVLGMSVVGAVVAYLVVVAPLLLPSVRRRDAEAHEDRVRMTFRFGRTDVIVVARLAVAAAIAASLAVPLGLHRAYWVIVAVVAILQNGHQIRVGAVRAIQRGIGTIVGVGLFALLALVHPAGVLLGLLLAVLQFCIEIVVVRNYGLALALITPLSLIIASQGGLAGSETVVLERVADTALGCAIALAVLAGAWLLRRARPNSPAL
jgi:hypothetical protein